MKGVERIKLKGPYRIHLVIKDMEGKPVVVQPYEHAVYPGDKIWIEVPEELEVLDV